MTAVIDSGATAEYLRTLAHHVRPIHPAVDGHDLHAPHLIDAEFLSIMRKMLFRRLVEDRVADAMSSEYQSMEIERYAHGPLLDRAWSLRDNITPYDALYVALAERLRVPLITTDRRLARAAAQYCEVITMD
jgi:predicted nucleic acid-binding protein